MTERKRFDLRSWTPLLATSVVVIGALITLYGSVVRTETHLTDVEERIASHLNTPGPHITPERRGMVDQMFANVSHLDRRLAQIEGRLERIEAILLRMDGRWPDR